jgi:hypothetical protein
MVMAACTCGQAHKKLGEVSCSRRTAVLSRPGWPDGSGESYENLPVAPNLTEFTGLREGRSVTGISLT